MILESIAQKTEREMREAGKVVTLSKETSYAIDHDLAMGLEPIKKESERRQRMSWAQINDYESGRANLKKKPVYERIINYLTQFF